MPVRKDREGRVAHLRRLDRHLDQRAGAPAGAHEAVQRFQVSRQPFRRTAALTEHLKAEHTRTFLKAIGGIAAGPPRVHLLRPTDKD